MARIIELTRPDGRKVWLNADKFVQIERDGKDPQTTIYHEPWQGGDDGFLSFTYVKEEPWEIQKEAHAAIVIDGHICATGV